MDTEAEQLQQEIEQPTAKSQEQPTAEPHLQEQMSAASPQQEQMTSAASPEKEQTSAKSIQQESDQHRQQGVTVEDNAEKDLQRHQQTPEEEGDHATIPLPAHHSDTNTGAALGNRACMRSSNKASMNLNHLPFEERSGDPTKTFIVTRQKSLENKEFASPHSPDEQTQHSTATELHVVNESQQRRLRSLSEGATTETHAKENQERRPRSSSEGATTELHVNAREQDAESVSSNDSNWYSGSSFRTNQTPSSTPSPSRSRFNSRDLDNDVHGDVTQPASSENDADSWVHEHDTHNREVPYSSSSGRKHKAIYNCYPMCCTLL